MSYKAMFLDRDGVINIDYGYVHTIQKFEWRKGIFILCWSAQILGYKIYIITNQAGIAKGYYSLKEFLELTNWMLKEFMSKKIRIGRVYFCPYHVNAINSHYRVDSNWRKPNPGMIKQAIRENKIDKSKSIMIGDNETDKQACVSSGLKVFIDSNRKLWVVSAIIKMLRL